jgi:phosphoenolpyruvate carboxylase
MTDWLNKEPKTPIEVIEQMFQVLTLYELQKGTQYGEDRNKYKKAIKELKEQMEDKEKWSYTSDISDEDFIKLMNKQSNRILFWWGTCVVLSGFLGYLIGKY